MNLKKGFTLIELLVVIAIIAILAAILFPVFAQAKAAAKKTSALSNIKQVSTGVMIYLGDSDDVFPLGNGECWWQPRDGGWVQDTKNYIKSVPILRDPSDPLSNAHWQSWERGRDDIVAISFASNGMLQWDGTANSLFGVMGMVQGKSETACGGWMGRVTTNQTAVTQVADTVMLAERFGSQTTWGVGSIISGVNWWDWTGHNGDIPDGSRDGKPLLYGDGSGAVFNKNNRLGGVSAPYGDISVVSYVDGHAKAVNPISTNPDGKNRPQDNKWNAYR